MLHCSACNIIPTDSPRSCSRATAPRQTAPHRTGFVPVVAAPDCAQGRVPTESCAHQAASVDDDAVAGRPKSGQLGRSAVLPGQLSRAHGSRAQCLECHGCRLPRSSRCYLRCVDGRSAHARAVPCTHRVRAATSARCPPHAHSRVLPTRAGMARGGAQSSLVERAKRRCSFLRMARSQ